MRSQGLAQEEKEKYGVRVDKLKSLVVFAQYGNVPRWTNKESTRVRFREYYTHQ